MTYRIITVLIWYCTLTFLPTNLKAEDKAFSSIADSLQHELNNLTCDSIQMETIFKSIKKNRKQLKKQYISLLHHFTQKSIQMNFATGAMQGYDRIGLQYRFDRLFDSAIYYHNASLKLAIEHNNQKQQYYNYNNLGQVYRIQDLNIKAIAFYHKALEISERLGDNKSSSFTMNSLGAAYLVQNEPGKAMRYFRESAKIAVHRNDTRTMGHNYSSMGQLFLESGELDSALVYLQNAKKILIDAKWHGSIAITNNCIGQVYYAKGQFIEAEKYFNTALPELIKARKTRYQSLAYAFLGKIKLQQENMDSATIFLARAEYLALEAHSYYNLKQIHEAYFDLYQKQQQWQKAIQALALSKAYSDSIISLANVKAFQNLEVAYQSKQKEQQIELLSTQNKLKSQRIRIGAILVLVLIISIVFGIYMQQVRKKQGQYEKDKLRQQLMLSQMNPHFIYNALGSIQSFMYRNQGKKAAAYLGNFASLSRSILNNSTKDKVPLEEEIRTLENYLALEKMRLQDNFSFHFNYQNEVDAEFIQIPPMMIQPFVENSIKHGIKDMKDDGYIEVKFEDTGNLLKVEVIDNGVGINTTRSQKKKHQSKATEIFQQRIKIIKAQNKKLPSPIIKDLADDGKQGTKVTFYLPIFES